jgi:hypothetical protein
MSNRYKGGIISATPPTTTGGESGTASGAWTLEQQMQAQAAGLWPLQPTGPWIEDCFSTWLYTGNGSTQTINNGIDLAGKGGLVWGKNRTSAINHGLIDTVRGVSKWIGSNTTDAQDNSPGFYVTGFNSNGFTVGGGTVFNTNGDNYVSWTFREQPKFFDVVTWTGNGSVPRAIPHSLNSVPGCVIIKCTSNIQNWQVWHRSISTGDYNANATLFLNNTDAAVVYGNVAGPFTSTTITVGEDLNQIGRTYVAYLFAHNAGGFGLTGTDNVISCGSFTTPSSGDATITLGYEPQWLMVKSSSNASDWYMVDTMRGLSQTSQSRLDANLSSAEETTTSPWFKVTATGFTASADSIGGSRTFIYIAIRRGPMRVPTTGASVFDPEAYNGNSQINRLITTGFTTDVIWRTERFKTSGVAPAYNGNMSDRLSGSMLRTNLTDAQNTTQAPVVWGSNVGVIYPTDNFVNNATGSSYILYGWQRAPGFFDEVCYTGTGTQGTSVSHNLAVPPTLVIIKGRNQSGYEWVVLSTDAPDANGLFTGLNTTTQGYSRTGNFDFFGNSSSVYTAPTATTISLGNSVWVNNSGSTYICYLFATCPGVSKTGSYTGTGATQTINCGFTGGARFVLIKAASTTGNWLVWDTARGMIPSNDPYLAWNSTAAEVTSTDWVDTAATGFELSNAGGNLANTNGVSYIFLAIA